MRTFIVHIPFLYKFLIKKAGKPAFPFHMRGSVSDLENFLWTPEKFVLAERFPLRYPGRLLERSYGLFQSLEQKRAVSKIEHHQTMRILDCCAPR